MITNIEMEKYFKINYEKTKKHTKFMYTKLSLTAWVTGFSIDTWGETISFIKNIDIIVRNSQYDYCINFINKQAGITIQVTDARKKATELIESTALIASNLVLYASTEASFLLSKASMTASSLVKKAAVEASNLIIKAENIKNIDSLPDKIYKQKKCKLKKISQAIIFDIRIKNNIKKPLFVVLNLGGGSKNDW